jgi:methionyl-tRNA synthetase
MTKTKPKDRCEMCGKLINPKDYRSKYCKDCQGTVMWQAQTQLKNKEGPVYEKWLRNTKRGMMNYYIWMMKGAKERDRD